MAHKMISCLWFWSQALWPPCCSFNTVVPKLWYVSESSEELVKNRLLNQTPRVSDSVALEWGREFAFLTSCWCWWSYFENHWSNITYQQQSCLWPLALPGAFLYQIGSKNKSKEVSNWKNSKLWHQAMMTWYIHLILVFKLLRTE